MEKPQVLDVLLRFGKKRLTKSQKRILKKLMHENKNQSASRFSRNFGEPVSTVKRNLKILRGLGILDYGGKPIQLSPIGRFLGGEMFD